MAPLELGWPEQRPHRRQLAHDVLFGSASTGELLEQSPLLLGRISANDSECIDSLEQERIAGVP